MSVDIITEKKFSLTKAAEVLERSTVSLRRDIADGRLGCYRLGGRILVGESDIRNFLTASRVEPKA